MNKLAVLNPIKRYICILIWGVALTHAGMIVADPESTVVVVYPKSNEPIKFVFETIIGGIQSTNAHPTLFPISNDTNSKTFDAWLTNQDPNHVISLGRQPFTHLIDTKWKDRMIVGALFVKPSEISYPGISLYLDPTIIADNLNLILPNTKRVFVSDTTTTRRWINQANNAENNPQFKLLNSTNDSQNSLLARNYWSTLNIMNPTTDVLWLDHRIDNRLLYELVEKAWVRNLILISTNLSHVERGVMLAFHPNNALMGRRLGMLALQKSATESSEIIPLKDIKVAANQKVLDHLNITISKPLRQQLFITLR